MELRANCRRTHQCLAALRGARSLVGIHIHRQPQSNFDAFWLAKSEFGSRPHWKFQATGAILQREVDLIEEIFAPWDEKIPSADASRFTPLSEADRNFDFETKLRHDLIAIGLTEARTSH